MRSRLLFGVPGLLAGLYGLWLLFDTGWANVRATAVWAAGGVVVHDGLLAPLVLLICALGAWLLPARWRGPAVVGLLILGTVTVVAIPVLGRFGARADNPTLLDRNYWAGWLVIAGLTLTGVLVMALVGRRSRRPTRSGDGQSSRG